MTSTPLAHRGATTISIIIAFAGLLTAVGSVDEKNAHFDVASVRPVPKDMGAFARGGPGTNDPGRIMYHSTTFWYLLQRAYGVQGDQVVCPDWMNDGSYFYDINATLPRDTTEDSFRAMLRNLLVERFHLVVHKVQKPFPGYALSLTGGPLKLALSHADTNDPQQAVLPAPPAGFPAIQPGKKFAITGPRLAESGLFRGTYHETIVDFLAYLPYQIRKSNREVPHALDAMLPRVIDRTGLTGVYDFCLEFFGGATDEPGGPSLFDALQHQLGLRLTRIKDIPVDVIVVDSADRVPVEN